MNTLVKTALQGFGLALGLLVTALPARAGFQVTFENVGPGGGGAGQFNWHADPAITGILYTPFGNGSASANHFVAFCIQTNQFISGGTTYTYDFVELEAAPVPGAPMSAATATNLRLMWGQYRDDIDIGDTTNKSIAFQYAIWYLLGLADPISVPATAQGYFATYTTSASWTADEANLAAMVSPDQQDQLVELVGDTPPGNLSVVPAPPAVLLALAGIIPCLALRRRLAGRTA